MSVSRKRNRVSRQPSSNRAKHDFQLLRGRKILQEEIQLRNEMYQQNFFLCLHRIFGDDIIKSKEEIDTETMKNNQINTTMLPADLWFKILRYLIPSELAVISRCCLFFDKVSSSDVIWESIYLATYPQNLLMESDGDGDNGVLFKHRFIERKKGAIKIGQLWKKQSQDYFSPWIKIMIVIHDIYVSHYVIGKRLPSPRKRKGSNNNVNENQMINVPEFSFKLEDCEICLVESWFGSKYRFNIVCEKKWKLGLLELILKMIEMNGLWH